jgi:hypothetical protein
VLIGQSPLERRQAALPPLEAVEEEAEPVAPTPEDIQKLIQTAPKYGLEIRMPHS